MNSVFKLSCSRLALLAAFGLAASFAPAAAADLGGDCCADLEERVAELEATTARKGNRKVSLTVSGWVNEEVLWWDDGSESNVYVGTNNLEQSRVRFTGDAKINADWSAGYTLEIGVWGHDSSRWNQAGPSDPATTGSHDNSMQVRKSNWWLKSKTFGKFTVGLEGTATYHLLDDADGANTRNYSDAQAAAVAQGSFFLRSGGVGNNPTIDALKWSDVLRGVDNATPGQNGRRNIVRYDSPEFAGFVATASWGEDDMWGMALTYKNKLGDFKLVGKAGYEHNSDEHSSACSSTLSAQDCEWWGAAGTIMHVPTGLYAYGGFGQMNDNRENQVALADPKDTMWFIQAGIEQKFVPLGTTTLFGEYRHDDAGSNLGKSFTAEGVTGFVHDTDANFWAGGVVQNIEAAAMDLYVIYRHADASTTNSLGGTAEIDPFDMVITGARIQF